MEEDDAVGEGFGGEEVEADGAMARLNEGDALADEDGKRRREQQRFCAAPPVLPIVASIFTQPLRAGLTCDTPTALLGSENSNPAEQFFPRLKGRAARLGRRALQAADRRVSTFTELRRLRQNSGEDCVGRACLGLHSPGCREG